MTTHFYTEIWIFLQKNVSTLHYFSSQIFDICERFFLIDWISRAVFENNTRFYAPIGHIEKRTFL